MSNNKREIISTIVENEHGYMVALTVHHNGGDIPFYQQSKIALTNYDDAVVWLNEMLIEYKYKCQEVNGSVDDVPIDPEHYAKSTAIALYKPEELN